MPKSLIAQTGKESRDRGIDFEPEMVKAINNHIKSPAAHHKASDGPRSLKSVAMQGARRIVDHMKKKNIRVTSAVQAPKNSRRDDMRLKASDEDVASVSLKIMQRTKEGRLRAPTERNGTVKSVADEMSSFHSMFKTLAVKHADDHKRKISGILNGKSYDAIKHSTHPAMKKVVDDVKRASHESRAAIADSLRFHMSLMKPHELHGFLHKHLHGGELIPLPHIRYMAVLPHHHQDEILHSLSEPKETFKHVMSKYGGSLKVHYQPGAMISRVHIHGADPLSGNKVTIATLNITDKGRPHRSPDIITTTRMPKLAATIRKNSHNNPPETE